MGALLISDYKFLDTIQFNFTDDTPISEQIQTILDNPVSKSAVQQQIPVFQGRESLVCPHFLEKLVTCNAFREAAKINLLGGQDDDMVSCVLKISQLVRACVTLITQDFCSSTTDWDSYNRKVEEQGFVRVVSEGTETSRYNAYWNYEMAALWLVTSSSARGALTVNSSDLHLCGTWKEGQELTNLRSSKHHVLMSDVMSIMIDMRNQPLAKLTTLKGAVDPVQFWPESNIGSVAFKRNISKLPADVKDSIFSQSHESMPFVEKVKVAMLALSSREMERAKLYHGIRSYHSPSESVTIQLRAALESSFKPKDIQNAIICANGILYGVPRIESISVRLDKYVSLLSKDELEPYFHYIEKNIESYREIISSSDISMLRALF